MSKPNVLVVTSPGVHSHVAMPILASLRAVGCEVRATDSGRFGAPNGGAVDWVIRAIGSDVVERRLEKEVDEVRPDVAIAFEPRVVQALVEARNECVRPFPVAAVVPELAPREAWQRCQADRLFTVDDEAAVALADLGIDGDRIIVCGAFNRGAFAVATRQGRSALKSKFGLNGSVVLVDVDGLGADAASQLSLQLSLVEGEHTFLFDAGNDSDAAAAIRAQVPILGMKGKLFGDTSDAPLLWRCADRIIARPTAETTSRAMISGAPLVALQPSQGEQSSLAQAMEERGIGAIAKNALLVGGALEAAGRGHGSHVVEGMDGAGNVADACYLMGLDRADMVGEKRDAVAEQRRAGVAGAAEFADWAQGAARPAGGLEDLGGGGGGGTSRPPVAPDPQKLRRLRKQISDRKAQVTRTIADAQKEAARWQQKAESATKLDNESMRKQAERNADLERSRMHAALAEMAGLQSEEEALERAAKAARDAPPMPPPAAPASARSTSRDEPAPARPAAPRSVEEELERLRRQAGSSSPKAAPKKKKRKKAASDVDDELAALKRKMARKRNGR